MITIDSIATTIEQGLNSSAKAYKFKFKIFVDAGKFKRATKTRTEKGLFINSLLRVGESSIVPVQGMTVATQSAVLEVCVPIFNEEQIDEVSTLFRNMLDGYFAMYKVQSIDGYTVSSTYSLASTGTLEARGNIGPSLTFYVNMEFGYIENGLNSANCTFTLDGFPIPYTSARITRTPTAESNSYAKNYGRSTSVNTAYLRGFDFEMPALTDGNMSQLIIQILLRDEPLNTIHTLVFNMNGVEDTYSVVLGTNELNLQGIDNGRLAFSLVEAAKFTEDDNGTV